MFLPPQIEPNIITEKEDYYISYNPVDVSTYGDVTTAIVVGQMEHFYILNGNHYKTLCSMKSFDECIAYFNANLHLKSRFSE
jgi:hypothetical protein